MYIFLLLLPCIVVGEPEKSTGYRTCASGSVCVCAGDEVPCAYERDEGLKVHTYSGCIPNSRRSSCCPATQDWRYLINSFHDTCIKKNEELTGHSVRIVDDTTAECADSDYPACKIREYNVNDKKWLYSFTCQHVDFPCTYNKLCYEPNKRKYCPRKDRCYLQDQYHDLCNEDDLEDTTLDLNVDVDNTKSGATALGPAFSSIFRDSNPSRNPAISRSLIHGVTRPANSTWDEKTFAMDCDPFVEENYPELCGEIALRQAFEPPQLTDHPDCNQLGKGIECSCKKNGEINLSGRFWTLPQRTVWVKIKNCRQVKIGNFFSDSENTKLGQVFLENIEHLTLLSNSFNLANGTVLIIGIPNLVIKKKAFHSSLKHLGLLNSEIVDLEEGAFHDLDNLDLFGIKNVTFPHFVAGKTLLSPNKVKIKELSLLDSNVGQMSYMFVNASSDKVLIINNLMDLVLDEGPVFDVTANNLVIANNFFKEIRTNAMEFDVNEAVEITGNVIEYARKLFLKNIIPKRASTKFTFANNTFKNQFASASLIFDIDVLKLVPANIHLANIILEKQCSCLLLQKTLKTKETQKEILEEKGDGAEVDETWKAFEEKLDKSLGCFSEGGDTQLLSSMLEDCQSQISRVTTLAGAGLGMGATALLLIVSVSAMFLHMRRRQKESVKSDMKRLAVPEILPKEEDYHMELEETVEFAQGSLPDLLQTVGSADTTPHHSMQHINSSSKALSGYSNVLMRPDEPDIDEDKYSSMVIHTDRKSTEWVMVN